MSNRKEYHDTSAGDSDDDFQTAWGESMADYSQHQDELESSAPAEGWTFVPVTTPQPQSFFVKERPDHSSTFAPMDMYIQGSENLQHWNGYSFNIDNTDVEFHNNYSNTIADIVGDLSIDQLKGSTNPSASSLDTREWKTHLEQEPAWYSFDEQPKPDGTIFDTNDIVLEEYIDLTAQNGTGSFGGQQRVGGVDPNRYQYRSVPTPNGNRYLWSDQENATIGVDSINSMAMDQQPWDPLRHNDSEHSTSTYRQTHFSRYGASSHGTSAGVPSQGDCSSSSNFPGTRTSYTSDLPNKHGMTDSTITVRPEPATRWSGPHGQPGDHQRLAAPMYK
jgi:hypothetical protein